MTYDWDGTESCGRCGVPSEPDELSCASVADVLDGVPITGPHREPCTREVAA